MSEVASCRRGFMAQSGIVRFVICFNIVGVTGPLLGDPVADVGDGKVRVFPNKSSNDNSPASRPPVDTCGCVDVVVVALNSGGYEVPMRGDKGGRCNASCKLILSTAAGR